MKSSHSQTLIAVLVGSTLLVVGAGGGYWWSQHAMHAEMVMPSQTSDTADAAMPAEGKGKVLYWYDPMYPQQHFDKPGKSPFMDMQLVPKHAGAGDDASAGIKIDAVVTQNLGMRLAPVTRIARTTHIAASGIVGFNERDVAIVQSRAAGFVARVAALAPGDVVKRGQTLLEVEIPEWLAAQHEFLALKSSGDPALLAAGRDRLRSLGMSEAMIREVEAGRQARTQFTVVAPLGGVIQSLDVRNGMTLSAGQALVRINGLATVWLEVAVPEVQAAQVRVGSKATAQVAGMSEPISGTVTSIVPELSGASRSLRVRVELPNTQGQLFPGQSAQVELSGDHGVTDERVLAVPSEAVIRTGKRAVVMVAEAGGHYAPMEVTLGGEIGNQTVILSGLDEGQQVVASGQFLIDSEASLQGIVARVASKSNAVTAAALHEAEARIVDIDLGAKEVTLAHGPFKTLSMPGMTMPFPLGNVDLIKGYKVGDRVRVGVRESDDGLIVERIEKLEGERVAQ